LLVKSLIITYFSLPPSSPPGITGFESAANYVEEMRDPGVFVTTVNWLW
jgi:hypothetical protein